MHTATDDPQARRRPKLRFVRQVDTNGDPIVICYYGSTMVGRGRTNAEAIVDATEFVRDCSQKLLAAVPAITLAVAA